MAVVEGSSTVRMVEGVVGAEDPTTSGMVIEAEAKTTSDDVEASG